MKILWIKEMKIITGLINILGIMPKPLPKRLMNIQTEASIVNLHISIAMYSTKITRKIYGDVLN